MRAPRSMTLPSPRTFPGSGRLVPRNHATYRARLRGTWVARPRRGKNGGVWLASTGWLFPGSMANGELASSPTPSGHVSRPRTRCHHLARDHERAIAKATAALGIVEAVEDIGLEVMARVNLGPPFYHLGEHRRAVPSLERAIDLSGGKRLHARMGLANIASVVARSWLIRCLAE